MSPLTIDHDDNVQVLFDVYSTAAVFSNVYDKIVLNIGNGWISASNTFSAPAAGIYYLSYSFSGVVGSSTWFDLLVSIVVLILLLCYRKNGTFLDIYKSQQITKSNAQIRACYDNTSLVLTNAATPLHRYG